MLGYLLSKPDDWKVRLYDLVRRGPAGVHKIQRILRELESAGYLRRVRFKRPNGAFDWETTVHEVPIRSLGRPAPRNSRAHTRESRVHTRESRASTRNTRATGRDFQPLSDEPGVAP